MRDFILRTTVALVALPAQAGEITVTATPVPLNPADVQQTQVDSLQFVAGFELTSPASEWGGYSGMVMSDDGSSIVAVSDVGHWLRLELTHDVDGKLSGVGAARTEPLQDEAGQPVAGKEWSDAEAVAAVSGGSYIVAFERNHRLWRYASVDGIPGGVATAVAAPSEISALPENSGVEALLADDSGALTLVAESGAAGVSHGWRQQGPDWQEFQIERSDGFEPTDLADAGKGKLALLERRYTEQDGSAARISLLPGIPTDGPQAAYTLAVLRLPLSVDNFECIATRPAPAGGRFIYLMSDNNQNPQQRTLLLQFYVPDIAAGGTAP
ncbi:MAG TPA: esterase-like activity of phytase family protein [Verrucomicrobiae bacterium]|nr:esterase-like activity of phytase family protein [Verrucomicrobiae bacterium]